MSPEDATPVVLVRVITEAEAAMIVGALGEQGIKAEAVGGAIAGFRAEAPGDVAVVVRADSLEEAQKILGELREEQADIDWSQIDVGEPE